MTSCSRTSRPLRQARAALFPRPVVRCMLRAWARTGWKRGRLWKAIERWGRLAAAAPVSTRIPSGATMICDLHDEIQRLIFFFGVYEAPEAYVFTRLLKPGLTVIDGGANVGLYTLLASHRVGPGGSVHAFEPIPRNFEILRRHAAQAANVVLNQTALWNSDDGVTLTLPAQHRINCGGWTVGKAAPTDRCVQVPSVTLDSYLASGRIDHVDAIKLDIEGAEPFALQGAMRALKRFLPINSDGSEPRHVGARRHHSFRAERSTLRAGLSLVESRKLRRDLRARH
jgi:FkbM family methyltransferase